jgi:ADP-ribose pyrophosphatase
VADDTVLIRAASGTMKGMTIASRDAVLTTPYFRLIAKRQTGQPTGEPYYSVESPDFVAVVAMTADGSVVLVRQFRPAVEMVTLELPAGHVEVGQEPAEAARVELVEETGFAAASLRLIGCLKTDTGRMANRTWVYFASPAERASHWQPEPDVEAIVAAPGDLNRWLNDGTFDHAPHVAALYLAVRAGCLQIPLESGSSL